MKCMIPYMVHIYDECVGQDKMMDLSEYGV